MNPFQKTYNFFKNLKTPHWLERAFAMAQDIVEDALVALGEEAVNFLRVQIFEQAKSNAPNEQKFKNVVLAFKGKYKDFNISDSMLNIAIEILLGVLKKEGILTPTE